VANRRPKSRPDWQDALRNWPKSIGARPGGRRLRQPGDWRSRPVSPGPRRSRFHPGFGEDLLSYQEWRRDGSPDRDRGPLTFLTSLATPSGCRRNEDQP